MAIEAEIVDVLPDVEYKGTVHEQRVIVELPDEIQIGLFDYDLHADPEMVGEVKSVSIFAYIPSEATVCNGEPGIVPNADDPLEWKHHVYRGKVTTVEGDGTVVLDIGYGDVRVDSDVHGSVEGRIREDMFLKVRVNRSDLVGLS